MLWPPSNEVGFAFHYKGRFRQSFAENGRTFLRVCQAISLEKKHPIPFAV